MVSFRTNPPYTCNTLQHTATHCDTLRHTATRCDTLRHSAAHYSTLQHTATHCNTLQRRGQENEKLCTSAQIVYIHTNNYVPQLPSKRQGDQLLIPTPIIHIHIHTNVWIPQNVRARRRATSRARRRGEQTKSLQFVGKLRGWGLEFRGFGFRI